MAHQLTRAEVAHIAELARLELSEAELDLFARQLADILTYAAAVQDVETRGIDPASQVESGPAAWRDDEPAASLDRREALAQAPDAQIDAGLYRVPKVI